MSDSDWGNLVEYSDDELLRRAVKNARSFHASSSSKHPRWIGVMSAFALGSTYSKMLCRRFGLDPDEEVSKGKLG
jgi:hypothetical protein